MMDYSNETENSRKRVLEKKRMNEQKGNNTTSKVIYFCITMDIHSNVCQLEFCVFLSTFYLGYCSRSFLYNVLREKNLLPIRYWPLRRCLGQSTVLAGFL